MILIEGIELFVHIMHIASPCYWVISNPHE
jgi:hypothetical protein